MDFSASPETDQGRHSCNDLSAESTTPIMPRKNWRTWSNPEKWNFHIVWKKENLYPGSARSVFERLFASAPQKSAPLFEDYEELKKDLKPDDMQILWIGHATLLIQMNGMNILTDPVFSDVAGPSRLGYRMGYKRYRKPAITIEKLKENGIEIHAVIISHNHYDHLDEQSVKALNERYQNIKWFVPMGLKGTILSWGCKQERNIEECTWWDHHKFKDYEFHFTPAKHWSGRGTLDWYTTLWGSWVIKGPHLTLFFAGDTGFQLELFDAIKKKFPAIDVAALPIGAYEPREMLKCQHINPEEAVKIHKLLEVKMSIGIHWATFQQLGTKTNAQIKEDLKSAMRMEEYNVKEEEFQTLEETLITTYTKLDEEADAKFNNLYDTD